MAVRGHVADAPRRRRAPIAAIAAAAMAVSLTGCLPGKSLMASATDTKQSEDALRHEADSWSKRYAASPGEKSVSLGYARILTALNQKGQAKAVLEAAAIKAPKDQEILAAYGKSLIDTGDYGQALDVLSHSHSPDRPDWRILSAEGIASDGMGMHDRAQSFYLAALRIAPGDPGVMSNLGLSYALSKKLPEAERVLTEAAQSPKADARVRQNLALVLALQGHFDTADQALRHDLSSADAANDVAQIREMMAQPNTWDAIRGKARQDDTRTAQAKALDAKTTLVQRSTGAQVSQTKAAQSQPSQAQVLQGQAAQGRASQSQASE